MIPMNADDRREHRKDLQAEWEEISEQLVMINDMCTIPGPEGPADREVRLLKSLDLIEDELELLDLEERQQH